MNNSGFYKKEETQILYAPNNVDGPNYLLVIADKDEYDYPVDGWIYAESLDSAIAYLQQTILVEFNHLMCSQKIINLLLTEMMKWSLLNLLIY